MLLCGALAWTAGAGAQNPPAPAKAAAPGKAAGKLGAARLQPVVEPRAMELLKAVGSTLSAARAVSFTAVASYEYPSKYGPPIVYTSRYEVTMQRPDKLRILMPGDGPASEFYYDGRTMIAFAPAENLAAFADAPPTIEAALAAAFKTAAIYFPFSDLLVADPYRAMADGVRLAFYVGPSAVVGGTRTEMMVWANDDVFVQIWIGAEDRLPRRMRAVFLADPLGRRHDLELSNWQLDPPLSAGIFTSEKAQGAWHSPRRCRRRRGRSRSSGARRRSRRRSRTDARNPTMKTILACTAALVAALFAVDEAAAWSRGNAAGGSTSHSWGSTSHENRWGGSSSHTAGQGSEHSNVYGGSTSHAYGGGTEHTNMYGGSTYGRYGSGAYHTYPSGYTAYHPPGYPAYPTYPVYHPPVAVPYYSSGCYGCAAAAGAVVGMAAGAAVASANSAAATSSAYSAGVAAGSATTAAATSAAYTAGVAAGAGATAVPASGTWVMGINYAALPAGAMAITKNGLTYYLSGNTWFQPAYGANGVTYKVVPTP